MLKTTGHLKYSMGPPDDDRDPLMSLGATAAMYSSTFDWVSWDPVCVSKGGRCPRGKLTQIYRSWLALTSCGPPTTLMDRRWHLVADGIALTLLRN